MITADRLLEIPDLSYYQLSQNRHAPYVHYEPTVEPNGESIAFFNGISMQANRAGNLPHALAAMGFDVYTIGLAEDRRSIFGRAFDSYMTMAEAAVRSTLQPYLTPIHWLTAINKIQHENRPPFTATLDRYAKDAAATMHGVIGKPSHVVGVSFGGVLAQQVGIDHPEIVTSVTGAATLPAVPVPLLKMPRMKAVSAVSMPWRTKATVGEIYGGDFNDPALFEEYSHLLKRQIQLLPHLEQQQAISLSFMLAWRSLFKRTILESKMPLAFLYSDDDPLIPRRLVEVGAMILHAEAHLFESGGHGFLFSRYAESAAKIGDIVTRHSLAAAA
ncbi:MAG TPA: alpha/beta hydrolase [Candidatus Saccharimonadales bacterium]|nr:alpha/beta hydrolase [Candidatus Saccharimonadales bacterium]